MMNYFTIAALAFGASAQSAIQRNLNATRNGNTAQGNLGHCPEGMLGCDPNTYTPSSLPQPASPADPVAPSNSNVVAGALGHNPVIQDANTCQQGMLGCDSNTWAPITYKQCEVGEMGCDPNTYAPNSNGTRQHVPVCYYLPADYNSDSNAMGSSAASWAPVLVNLDEDNHMKTVNAMNRETIVVRIPQQQGLSNYSFDAPAGEGALLLQDHSSDSEYYTWTFKVEGCMTREQLNFTAKSAPVNGQTQPDEQLTLNVAVGLDSYAH